MFFIKHQQQFVPVEEKRPSLDPVLVSSSSVSPPVSLLVSVDRCHTAPPGGQQVAVNGVDERSKVSVSRWQRRDWC